MNQPADTGSTSVTADLHMEICRSIVACQKQSGLYPKEHPRLKETLATLKADLKEYHGHTRQPFFLNISEALEKENEQGGSRNTDTADLVLARLLEHRLIEKLVVPPDVPEDELFEFCSLLRHDPKKEQRRDQVLGELNRLRQIRLSFYQLVDLPAAVTGEAGAPGESGSAEGVARDQALEELMAALPADIRESVEGILHKPETAKRILNIHNLVTKKSAEMGRSGELEISLLKEMVQAAVLAASRSESGASPAEVVSNFHNIVEFFEKHAESLVVTPHLLVGDLNSDELKLDLAKFSKDKTSLATAVEKFQRHKQKLSGLFQSQADAGKTSWDTARDPDAKVEREARPEHAKKAVPSPFEGREFLPDIVCDTAALRRSIAGRDRHINYLLVVLDLLTRDGTRESIKRRLSRINRRLGEVIKDRKLLPQLVDACTRTLSANESEEGREILLTLLARIDSPTELVKLFETVVLPASGPELTERIVYDLVDRQRRAAVHLLCAISGSEDETLRDIALRRLGYLAQNPVFLCAWANQDPRGLLAKTTFENVVNRIGLQRLTGSFKEFFSNATFRQAADFIEALEPDTPGAEHVVLAAAEYGPAALRKAALSSLHRFPTSMVITALIEIVKRNNYSSSPRFDEIEGALTALLGIEDPRAKEFLTEITTLRGWWRWVYRKEIRRTLAALRGAGRGGSA